MSHTTSLAMRWSDLDVQNHVNNVTYAEYLQEARVALLLEVGCRDMLDEGVVVVRHQVEYLRPIALSEEPVVVTSSITGLGASQFTYVHAILHEGQLCARARTICCPVSAQGTPRRLTAAQRDALARFVEPVEDMPALPWRGVGATPHLRPLSVRWSDQDWYRHVNNVRHLDFFQEARIRMVTPEPGLVWFIARHDVDYLDTMAFQQEPYEVASAVVSIGRTSMTLAGEIRRGGGEVVARSSCVVVCADAAGVPTPVPDSVREQMAPFAV